MIGALKFAGGTNMLMGGSPGLVVVVDDLCQEVACSNPSTGYWMDNFLIDLL